MAKPIGLNPEVVQSTHEITALRRNKIRTGDVTSCIFDPNSYVLSFMLSSDDRSDSDLGGIAMPTMPTTTASETRLKNLFERSLDGDQLAYREFLTAIGDLLRRYVQRQLYRFDRSAPDAEDIVQEVLLAIHAKRHVYDRDVPITAWAHAIARYKMIDYLRATGRSARDISLDEIEDLPADSGSQIDIVLSLGNLLAGLPDRFRRPIELVKINGFSTKEAAAATNTSEASVRVNVHRGLKSLLRSLE